MKNLRFVCCQPAISYYTWQVEVLINNFTAMGVNPNNIDVVCGIENGVVPEAWSKLANGYPARFFFYNDTRKTKHYTSSIRPNLLKQHWEARKEIRNDTIFYHDCDILFTKPVFDWITPEMINDDKWYGSDCRWYISHDYIISKGEDILDKMCEIMDIDKKVIKDNEMNGIGAQYIMKGLTSEYWATVEKDCENLFRDISAINNEKKKLDPKYHELQIWCADMWSVLWNGWKMGYETICSKNLDFSWATSSEEDYNKMNIFHNAGVTDKNMGLFYKALYMDKTPYETDYKPRPRTASWHYWDWVQRTKKVTVL